MGYHFGAGWLEGGFFSLDIFYVLSGYLITGLLLGEYASRGRIVLSRFWLRRARRLLPALLVVLVVVSLMVRFAEPQGLFPDFRLSALSALFYFSNWWQIAASTNYFAVTGVTSPLTHTWSLAVEEQFYLIWPLVVVAVMHTAKGFTRGVRILLAASAVGAVASMLEMALLYGPRANLTRLYFGTDTHAQSILIGSVLACSMTLIQTRRGVGGMAPRATGGTARLLLSLLGCAGLAGTALLTYTQEGTSPFAYRGGFMLSALSAAALIIGAVCVPGGPLAMCLSTRPLVWIGTVSYGAYLWHYPVFIELDPVRTGTTGLELFAIRFASTFVLAAASYYLVERPVMEGVFWRSLKALVPSGALLLGTVAVVVAATAQPATAAVGVHRFRSASPVTKPPVVVLLGDSTALTLGFALAATAPPGTRVENHGLFGCGFAIGSWVSNNPPTPQLAMFPACNEATPADQQWPRLDAVSVSGTTSGDVVLFVAGVWEVQDMLRNGQWVDITEQSFQRYELSQMRMAVRIGTAHGAHVDFATMPAMAEGASFGEPPFPQDQPRRRLIYDRLIKTVADEFPRSVSIVDYGAVLSPGGVFHEYLGHVQIRTADGIHTPSYAPGNPFAGNATEAVANAFYDWLSPRIWPLIIGQR